MPLLRSLKDTAPEADPGLAWPIHGMAYVIAFMGPLSAGPIMGILTRDWRTVITGILLGIGITFLNAWLSDRFLDAWIARFQQPLQSGMPRLLANIMAFIWAIGLSALSMMAPIAILGAGVLTRIH